MQPERVQTAESLEATIADAQFGSAAAIETLYRTFAPLVIGYLRGAGSTDAEDLASDVFVAMVARLPRFSGDEAAFRRWLFTIAHHRLVDERRRAATRRRMADSIAASTEHVVLAGDDTLLDRIEAASVRSALDVLTDDQRSVVLLRNVAELSVADTAAVLAKREGAVKTLHRRALAAMREHLGGVEA